MRNKYKSDCAISETENADAVAAASANSVVEGGFQTGENISAEGAQCEGLPAPLTIKISADEMGLVDQSCFKVVSQERGSLVERTEARTQHFSEAVAFAHLLAQELGASIEPLPDALRSFALPAAKT